MGSLVGLVVFCAALEGTVEVPSGTELRIRLATAIPAHAKAGLPLSAVLVVSIARDGNVVLPAGTLVHGGIAAAGVLPQDQHRSYLQLTFSAISVAGATVPIQARVSDVDNSRETVDTEGRILGLAWVPAKPTEVEALLLLAADAYPIMLALDEVDRAPIEYAAGTELTLRLIEAIRVDAPTRATGTPDLSSDRQLVGLAANLPTRTVAAQFKRASDLTNILLVGTRDELAGAFRDAGWTQAQPLGLETGARAFLALAERHGYQAAPVSLLQLDGAPPDLVFEKQNNTMAKRHHVRIWSRKGSFLGRALWLGAATHDIAIAFDRRDKTFTHRIDGRIDDERDTLMADLELTGRVRARALVERPSVPRLTQNATGDAVRTDGRLGVLVLDEETQPDR